MELAEVNDKKTIKDFSSFLSSIYKNDPYWIPHIKQEIEGVFDKNENPYFTHGECIRWVLYDDKKNPIGRVAAFINNKTAFTYEQPTGGMGFFECINNKEAAFMLFDACKKWLIERGMKAMDGPINFGEKDRYWGMLSEGRDKPAVYTMNHQPAYYNELFEQYGFANYYEQVIYYRPVQKPQNERMKAIAQRVGRDPNYRAERLQVSNSKKYAEDFRTIYNKAWKAERTDFEELSKERSLAIMHKLKPVLDPDISWFVYYKDEPIAVYISIPELNEIFRYVNGNMNLWGKLKFLWYFKTKGCKALMGIVFGVVPEFQGKGVEAVIFNEMGKIIQPKKVYDSILISWIGSFNQKMMHLLVALLDVVPYKKYITYRKIF